MTCCTAINADTNRFFSFFASLHRLRHRWLGFERTQRQLLEGRSSAGCCYRPFIHDSAMIAERLTAHGLHCIHEAGR